MLNFVEIIFGSSILISLIALTYGCEIAYLVVVAWIERYSGLRRLGIPDISNISVGASTSAAAAATRADVDAAASSSSCSDAFVERLTRDSQEFYLFFCRYIQNAGEIWNLSVMGMIVIFSYLFMRQAYYTIIDWHHAPLYIKVETVITVFLWVILLVVYPLLSIARVNSRVGQLTELFKFADDKDFQVLGGRAWWLDFHEAVPPLWRVMGVGVTWELLYQTAVGIATGGATLMVTLISMGIISVSDLGVST
jgi:hypothetical protein